MDLNNSTVQVITIDGPAGAGKSTVAKGLAQALGFAYLDTGAMYRALTFKALCQDLVLDNEDQLVELAKNTKIDVKPNMNGTKVLLDGEDVSLEIRTQDVTNNTFYIARAPKVREIMVQWQRSIGQKQSIVVEGRDTGTVVFPQAAYKFYIDAQVQERARRRFEELKAKEEEVDLNELTQAVIKRDDSDINRKVGALRKADDAILIDTTGLTADQTVKKMLAIVKNHG